MINSLLRCLSCFAFLAVVGVPAQGEGFRYAELPAELFVPETNPHRETAANVVTIGREMEAPTRIMSHGRQVRLVGVPFMPDLEESIDFVSAAESTWWSTMVADTLAGWLAPVEVEDAPALASIKESLRLADLQTAGNFVLE